MPSAGAIAGYPRSAQRTMAGSVAAGQDRLADQDTSYLCVVDKFGNAMSATPSDGCHSSPLVPSLGHVISPRGSQTWLDRSHPGSLVGGKRPRLTPNPAIVTRDGDLVMPFGTPGGDEQTQAMVQVFLNMFEFGMDPQQALEAPRILTYSHPSSFYPHASSPGRLELEHGFAPETVTQLGALGHDARYWDRDILDSCSVCAILVEPRHRTLVGGADPRKDSYAVGW